MLNVMLMDVYFLLIIFFICCVYDFMLCVWSLRESKEWVSIVSLPEWVKFLQGVQWSLSTRSALTEVRVHIWNLRRDNSCSHSHRSASWAQDSCKECAGRVKFQSLWTWEISKGLLLQGVRRVEGLQFFEVIEGFAARSACRSLL